MVLGKTQQSNHPINMIVKTTPVVGYILLLWGVATGYEPVKQPANIIAKSSGLLLVSFSCSFLPAINQAKSIQINQPTKINLNLHLQQP